MEQQSKQSSKRTFARQRPLSPISAEDAPAEYVQVKVAARRKGVIPWCIRQEVYSGRIRAKRYGQILLIEVASLNERFDNLPDAAATRVKVGGAHD